MTRPTFSIRENPDGTWAVIEIETGLPLERMNRVRLASLSTEDASGWLDLMLVCGRMDSIRRKLKRGPRE